MNEHSKVLKQYFGYDTFREGQEELVESILSGQDTLGLCLQEQENPYVFRFRH